MEYVLEKRCLKRCRFSFWVKVKEFGLEEKIRRKEKFRGKRKGRFRFGKGEKRSWKNGEEVCVKWRLAAKG